MGTTILLTGLPGSGKTTAIRKIISQLHGPMGGFYTQEVRRAGQRVGFEIITLAGQRGLLAHVDLPGPDRVGKYGVDLDALDSLGVGAVQAAVAAKDLVVIDEIGPMELRSRAFLRAVREALDSEAIVLASLVWQSTPFTRRVRAHPAVTVLELQLENRDHLVHEVLRWLNDLGVR